MTAENNREAFAGWSRFLRANPRYRLILVDRLSEPERLALGPSALEEKFYGLLRPISDDSLATRGIDRETALLFLTLHEPGPLPAYALRELGARANETVQALVRDHVLEVDAGDGTYHSGPAALRTSVEAPALRGQNADVSLDAIKLAWHTPIDDADVLAGRLYAFNRLPLTSRAEAALAPVVERVASGGMVQADLERGWHRDESVGWRIWRSRIPRHRSSGRQPSWKLYVSPRPDFVLEAFNRVVPVLTRHGWPQFKIGRDSSGLLRPDKFVVYFDRLTDLMSAGRAVCDATDDLDAQPVPFTSGFSAKGTCSWGFDPGSSDREAIGSTRSWREIVTGQLARALVDARARRETDGVGFALAAASEAGIDPRTWAPRSETWGRFTGSSAT